MSDTEIPLSGGNVNVGVIRVGNTVRRHPGKASAATHALLRHLADQSFSGSPKLLGVDEKGREILTFIEGSAGQWPAIWSNQIALESAATLLRRYHDSTTALVGQVEGWVYQYPDTGRHEVICHNDYGAYNIVFQEMKAVGVIDFDLAGPGPRLKDIAYGAYWMTPLSLNAEDMRPFAEADLKAKSRRLRQFCESYGIEADKRLIDMIEEVLWLMGDEEHAKRVVGEAAAAKLIAEGHLVGWRGEAESFARHRNLLLTSLGIR
jgi:hypothetical protein